MYNPEQACASMLLHREQDILKTIGYIVQAGRLFPYQYAELLTSVVSYYLSQGQGFYLLAYRDCMDYRSSITLNDKRG